tara:strand:- start:278 stop:463 length:186 start_codon:yes stop_codon:yes gene_type:complete
MERIKLTSVKVDKKEQYTFKKICLENGMNFQKLVNRALYLYNTDKRFRKTIDSKMDLIKRF